MTRDVTVFRMYTKGKHSYVSTRACTHAHTHSIKTRM